MTLIFNSLQTMAMTRTQEKYHGQKSVGSELKVETDGRTDTSDRFSVPANAVGN